VCADAATEAALSLACQVARSDLPVLVTGPNGAGKEKIAEIVHANSAVKHGPFVALNCGALPGELIEAELFGSEAGAYTGAQRAREGEFEAADGGTLFLDEIGTLPPAGQVKLLRVLETGAFQRLGGNRARQVKVRIVSATNADLRALIASGQFREDLFYRLNAIEVALPPLAERADDILPLARHFLPPGKTLGDDAMRALLAHRWPGNVRELRNTLESMMVLADGETMSERDLPESIAEGSQAAATPKEIPTGLTMEELERLAITKALDQFGGNRTHAANRLGISVRTLQRKLRQYELERRVKPFPNDILTEA